jgi:hypothetical protein
VTNRRRVVAILAALVSIVAGCNTLLGVDSHPLAPDAGSPGTAGGSGGAGTAGSSGGNTGTAGSAGENYGATSCGVDGSAVDGSVDGAEGADVDAGTGVTCGFTMPNPESSNPLVLPNQASYRVNTADDTVTDLVTGLTWERNAGFQVYPQDQANTPCDAKGSGWRLPTRVELVSLVDFTVASPGPTMNKIFANDLVFANSADTRAFWTSSHAACNTLIGWLVDFSNGRTRQDKSNLPCKVRCVKGAPSYCSLARFKVQMGEVHDLATGLFWQQDVASDLTWTASMQHCPPGWRLPSLTEIQTIVDETTQTPAIFAAFLNTPAGPSSNPTFWTSSPSASDPSRAWFATFYHGHSDTLPITTGAFVRCVR